MSILPDLRSRVLYAKYLLQRARDVVGERSDLGIGTAVLLMHDSVEMLMLAVVEHLNIRMPKRWEFTDFWAEIGKTHPEPPSRVLMDSLNNMRVGLKHKGNMPNAKRVRELLPRVEAFCEEVSALYLDGLVFSELTMADFVENTEARAALNEANSAKREGRGNDAYTQLRIAFDKIIREASSDVPLPKVPPAVRIPGGLPGSLGRDLDDFQKAVRESVRTLNIFLLGIDPFKYAYFLKNTPNVQWAVAGNYQVILTKEYDTLADEVFQTCFDFVVEVALQTGGLFKP